MINSNRIVPVTATDLISLYGTIFTISTGGEGNPPTALSADGIGEFSVSAAGTFLANEPVVSCDFAAAADGAIVLFVPAYDFKGFTIAGEAAEYTGDVDADGCTLYSVGYANDALTVIKVGF